MRSADVDTDTRSAVGCESSAEPAATPKIVPDSDNTHTPAAEHTLEFDSGFDSGFGSGFDFAFEPEAEAQLKLEHSPSSPMLCDHCAHSALANQFARERPDSGAG